MNDYRHFSGPGFSGILRRVYSACLGTLSLKLVIVCVTAFLVVSALSITGVWRREQIISLFGLSWVGVFQCHWLHQFLTAPLLHANVTHLLFNMLSLWMMGPGVEAVLGRRRYVCFSIICATAASAGWLLCNWGTGHIAIGYSGVIFGILVAQAMFFPNATIALFVFFPLKMKHAVFLLGAVELYLTISPEDQGVAHAAHLFGALAALVYLRTVNWRQHDPARKPAPPNPTIKTRPQAAARRFKVPFEL